MPLPVYEQLGAFYLGKSYDLAARTRGHELLMYDSKDLVTHAVCVGMTGSGKTGLCLSLLEEAAIDGIPAIVIDPKGDLGNLLLTFPQLRPEDFRPWINADDARVKGLSPDEFAAQQASMWAKGLADWQQDGARIARLKGAADFTIYTPGSRSGVSVSVLKSFTCPDGATLDDPELLREQLAGTVASLLGMLRIDTGDGASRESLLLSTILARSWEAGESIDLGALISRVQTPPFTRIGVMELESIYPAKDRFALAMALNNLVAAPGFANWLEGVPLDIASMLYTKEGRPRIAIFSIAHLGDAERMFFVSMLMNQILTWTRKQSGTSSLRAIVYMDEIAGYFPPVANPPSKQPMLTMMKQARAFGVGMVLATQNPVDLDYKGLANAGTWFIGRLQTDRDKQRVLDGLEGAAANSGASFDRVELDTMLSQLGQRVFLMNNVHESRPVVFESRWCMSYLRGPLTREQIKSLTGASSASALASVQAPATPAQSAAAAPAPSPAPTPSSSRPMLPPDITVRFIAARAREGITYRPYVFGTAKVYYNDAKAGITAEQSATMLAPIGDGAIGADFDSAESVGLSLGDLETEPLANSSFADLPPSATKAKSYDAWGKQLIDALFRTHTLELQRCAGLKLVALTTESKGEFAARVAFAVHELRDERVEKLRMKYSPKVNALQDRVRRAHQAAEVQKNQASQSNLGTALSVGTALFGAFFARKAAGASSISRASTAVRTASRSMKESADVTRAEENIDALKAQLADLQAEFEGETHVIKAELDALASDITSVQLKPKKSDIQPKAVLLVWAPWSAGAPAW